MFACAVTGAGQLCFSQVPRPELVTQETEASIQSGLSWLARQQETATGGFGRRDGTAPNVGVTALAGMAFLASGSTPGVGPYGAELERITTYLLSRCNATGFIAETGEAASQGPMYGHGFATMYLAEVYGMSDAPNLREHLKSAVNLIIATQNEQGGWRYFPVADEADISVTVCQVMALRAARNAGLSVPKEVIDRAVAYLRQCQNTDGGFRYRVFDAAESRVPRSAAALVALYSSGVTEGPVLDSGFRYLRQYVPGPRTPRDSQYYFYSQYYAAQAAWHAGGEQWTTWYPALRDELLRLQVPAAGWRDPWIGDEYATAMALVALQMPYDFVPILER